MTRVFFESEAEVAMGPKCLGAEVSRVDLSRGRCGNGAEVSAIRLK